jgi:putative oxidoreductase
MERPASDLALLIGRVALAALFIPAGLSKLTDVGAFAASLEKRGVPLADVLAPIGAAVEFFAGIAVLIGFQTRAAAVLMVLFTVAATLIAHRFWEFDGAARATQQSAFFKNLAIVGGYLVLMVSGGGRYSIDGLLHRRATQEERRVRERRGSTPVPGLSRR